MDTEPTETPAPAPETGDEANAQARANAVILLTTAALTLDSPDDADAVIFDEGSPFMDMDPLFAWGAIIALAIVAEAGGVTADNLRVAAVTLAGADPDDFDIPPVVQECPQCKGQQNFDMGGDLNEPCPTCNGTGECTVEQAAAYYLAAT